VAIDAAGSVHLGGLTAGTITLDKPIGADGFNRGFVARLADDGEPAWSHDFEGLFADMALAAAPSGSVWVAGGFRQTIVVPRGITSISATDIFFARIEGDQFIDATGIGGGNDQEGVVLTVDAAGAPYAAARFKSSFQVGNFPLSSTGGDDVALLHWDANGAPVSANSFGALNDDVPTGLAVVGSSLLVAGWYRDTFTFGNCATNGARTPDHFLFALDSQLATCGDSTIWGNPNVAMPVYLASLGQSVVVAGNSDAALNLVGGNTAGGSDMYLALVANQADLPVIWGRAFGDPAEQHVRDVVACGDRIVMAGHIAGTVDFGLGPKPGIDPDAFVAAFDASGNPLWDVRWRSAALGTLRSTAAVAVNAACDRVAVFGTFSGGIDFGEGEIPAISSSDLFVALLAI
jgi:hypothetical protein